MRGLNNTIFFIFIFLLSCRKDVGLKPTSIPSIETTDTFICEDTTLNWEKFPDPPWSGYDFYTEKPKETVSHVLYDPNDKYIFYYTTDEGNNFHHLWKFNRRTKTKTLLDMNVLINIDINKNGWLVYDKQDLNIYKIKTTGDSLTKLTTRGSYAYPAISNNGLNIFYWDKSNPKGFIYVADFNGKVLDTIKQIYGQIYPIKNFIYYLKLSNNVFYLIQRDLTTGNEKNILVRNVGNSAGESFSSFYTNEDNTILYWWGDHGLSKTDLSTLETTRLVNGGYGSQGQIMQFRRSPISGRFLAIQFNQTLVNSYTIKASNKILEFTEDGKCRRSIEIPD